MLVHNSDVLFLLNWCVWHDCGMKCSRFEKLIRACVVICLIDIELKKKKYTYPTYVILTLDLIGTIKKVYLSVVFFIQINKIK